MILLTVLGLSTAIVVGMVFFYLNNCFRHLISIYLLIGGLGSFGASLAVGALGYGSLTSYSEIWNFRANAVNYYEEWTEQVTTVTTDGNGNTQVHISYDYHSPYWTATDQYGDEHRINKYDYKYWKDKWNNEHKINLTHFNQSSFGDGDKFQSKWVGTFDTMLPLSDIHKYENKIRASDSIWANKGPVDKEFAKKFPRPADVNNVDPVISHGVVHGENEFWWLKRINAVLGPEYEVHTIAFLLNAKDYPDRSVIEKILSAWNGPNKNELITFVGLDNNKIIWCDTISWMDDTTIHSMIRQDVMQLDNWNGFAYGEILKKRVPQYWKRKDFADFDHIAVSMPGWTIPIAVAASFGMCMFGCFVCVKKS